MKTVFYHGANNLWIILQFIFELSQSQNLSVTYSSAKLPIREYAHSAWYDGKDDIYLIGGTYEKSERILRYSFSTDSIHWEGGLSIGARYGSVHSDLDGNIFYFGAGHNDYDKVIKYSPTASSSSVEATLPHSIWSIPTIKLDNNTVLILGSYPSGSDISSFDLATGTTIKLEAKLPINVCFGAAIKFGKDKVYLFPVDKGILRSRESGNMWELDLRSMTFKKTDLELPHFQMYPSVMTNGALVYVQTTFEPSSRFKRDGGIFVIDPVAMTTQFLHVDNWPGFEDHHPPPSVYVNKLRRIYSFGGVSTEGEEVDDIFYINLSSLPKPRMNSAIGTGIGLVIIVAIVILLVTQLY